MLNKDSNKFTRKVSAYVRVNWGSPFIVLSIGLLSSSAFFLFVDLVSLAESISEFTFYSLLIGVVLQLLSFWKHHKDNEMGVF